MGQFRKIMDFLAFRSFSSFTSKSYKYKHLNFSIFCKFLQNWSKKIKIIYYAQIKFQSILIKPNIAIEAKKFLE